MRQARAADSINVNDAPPVSGKDQRDIATPVQQAAVNEMNQGAAGEKRDGAAVAAATRVEEAAAKTAAAAAESVKPSIVGEATQNVRSYIEEGQRIATERTAQLQETAKKAVTTAQNYFEDAKKKTDPYVESAKVQVESVRESAHQVVERAMNGVGQAKEQVNAIKEKVSERAQPVIRDVNSYDITKATVFHVATHVISVILYIIWRVSLWVPAVETAVVATQQRISESSILCKIKSGVESVPKVGGRAVMIVAQAHGEVMKDFYEQVDQYKKQSEPAKSKSD